MSHVQSYQRYYHENQYIFSPFSPIENTKNDIYHSDLILQNNKDKFQQLLKEDKNVLLSHWLFNQSFQKSITSYLTYRNRPIDVVENSNDLFEYDRLVFLLFAQVAQTSVPNEQEIFETIPLFRLPSLISLGSIMGDSNLTNFRVIFQQLHSKRPSLSQEFESTIQETQRTLDQLYKSLDASISSKQGGPKSKYLTGAPPQQNKPMKTGSGIRAVNMKANKKLKEPQIESAESTQLASLPSFSESVEFALDISYFLSILSAVSQPYFTSGGNISEIGHSYLICITQLYELIIPLLAKGIALYSTAEDQTQIWKRMVTLSRNRLLQSMFMTIVTTCHSFQIPVSANEIQSFPWLSDNSNEATISFIPYHLSWSELIVQMISGEIIQSSFEGTLFGDLTKIYSQTMIKFLEKVFENEDEDKRSYLMSIIRYSPSAAHPPPTNQSNNSKRSSVVKEEAPSPSPAIPTQQSLIQDVKNIFPDYGEFFISCVLEAYGQNPERAIDALLSENLPVNLQKMDRTTKSAWMGKSSTDAAVAVSRKGNEVKYSLELNAKDKEIQKLRLRQLEQKQEEDSRLLSLETEYGDDYDDQYDEGGGGYKPSNNWQEEREKILRVNKLMLNEEAEDAYWMGMSNTNKKGMSIANNREENSVEEGEGEEGEGGGVRVGGEETRGEGKKEQTNKKSENVPSLRNSKSKQQHPPPSSSSSGAAGRGSTRTGSTGRGATTGAANSPKGDPKKHPVVDIRTQNNLQQRKPKTKTFDKHHQKDKNLRKFGGFM